MSSGRAGRRRGMTDAMPTAAPPLLCEREARPYLAIPAQVRGSAQLRGAADRGFPTLFRRLGERGVAPAGPPFIRYGRLHPDGSPAAIEIAVPVAEPVAGDAPVSAGILPAGRWLSHVHVGPYAHDTLPGLGDAHRAVRAWAAEHGVALAGAVCEHYRVGPVEEPDFTRWQTELAYEVWPRRS